MEIAEDRVLSNTTHGSHLPASWRTLYELAQLPKHGLDLEVLIEEGAIHPKMERKDALALLPAPEQRDDDLPPDYEGSAEPAVGSNDSAMEEGRTLAAAAREAELEQVQVLAQKLRVADLKIVGLESENEELRAERDQLRARVAELESVLATSGAVQGEKPKRGRGRPKGSKNKPKSPPAENTAAPPQRGEDNAPPPEVGAEIMRAKMAALDDGLDVPEFLRRAS
jgi:hypothetical protein